MRAWAGMVRLRRCWPGHWQCLNREMTGFTQHSTSVFSVTQTGKLDDVGFPASFLPSFCVARENPLVAVYCT